MSYVISIETKDAEPKVFYWNRRKGVWQSHVSKACLYPTYSGSRVIWKGMAHVNWPYIEGRPVHSITHKPATE